MKYQVLITSVPDRNNLVAEIWEGENLLAEINQEFDTLKVEIYGKSSDLLLEYEDFLNALIEAKSKLLDK